jgi:hypothetical protein
VLKCFLLGIFTIAAANAQMDEYQGVHWEVGAAGGYGFSSENLNSGPAFSAFFGDDTYNYFGGEVRYTYRFDDFNLSSRATSFATTAHTHIAEGAFLGYFRPRSSAIRPFVVFGGGVKILDGIGIRRDIFPTADAGLGIKFSAGTHLRIRFELRDYIGPMPRILGTAGGSVANDVTGLGGISYMW